MRDGAPAGIDPALVEKVKRRQAEQEIEAIFSPLPDAEVADLPTFESTEPSPEPTDARGLTAADRVAIEANDRRRRMARELREAGVDPRGYAEHEDSRRLTGGTGTY